MTAIATRSSAPLVPGEYVLTARNFEQISNFLRRTTGIALPTTKATLVYSRLAKRLRRLGLDTFDQYWDHIQSEDGKAERNEMVEALTTNVTRFFREPHHFDHLRQDVAPRLHLAARSRGRVRLWSAACSSGEEPYSMAIALLAGAPDLINYDVRILATDIDSNVIARGRTGRYSEAAAAPIPSDLRARWMIHDRSQSTWRIKDEVRAMVSFNHLNLIEPWPMKGKFDVIFCRNVVIYFEEATQMALWKRFRAAMHSDGYLYVGHSERVDIPDFAGAGQTIYRPTGSA